MRPSAAAVLSAAVAVSLTACGRSANQSADQNGADTTSASKSVLGPPVGSMKPTMDSAVAQGKERLDSLKSAGVGTKGALDSAESRVQRATANDPSRDTSMLNNRATRRDAQGRPHP